jgi:two-component system, OmpR family, response regulator ChvI
MTDSRAETRGGARIAIVEDEDTIREAVSFALRQQGHQAQGFADGLDAWTAFDAALPDLVILDIGLPRLDGLELCRRLRGRSEALPIIFVTSREDEFDRVLGLEIGADDYLCKPFSMRELLARIKVLLRRAALAANAGGGAGGVAGAGAAAAAGAGAGAGVGVGAGEDSAEERLLEAGSLRLDLQRYTAAWKGRALALTVTEFLLLQALVRHPGHVKTRDQLMQHAYPDNTFVSDRTIDSHVKRVRRKLEEIDPRFASIETVYGLGYRFTTDTDTQDSAATATGTAGAPDAAGTRPPKRDTPDTNTQGSAATETAGAPDAAGTRPPKRDTPDTDTPGSAATETAGAPDAVGTRPPKRGTPGGQTR